VTIADIAYARLHNQRLSASSVTRPEDVVAWLGAVQAQEFVGSKWALMLRLRQSTHAAIDRAFAAGRILRTHVMRPTWHFVAPRDIRWMLELTAPRVRKVLASYDRRLGIDAAVVARANRAIAAALRGGQHLTRPELRAVLQESGVAADGTQRLAHLSMHAELDGVICSGALRGKQFTYALLDERVPEAPSLTRDEALAELTRRYFTSHGPAQLQDFVWWSGLTTADARLGLEMSQAHLAEEVVKGKTYWSSRSRREIPRPERAACLLPLYDEFLIAYKDRSASIDAAVWRPVITRDGFSAPIVVDGRVVGGWRAVTSTRLTVLLDVPCALSRRDERLVADAVARFGAFMGLETVTVRR
jgi:hypothetical protein